MAFDEMGRVTSDAAQAMYDAKLMSPEDNLAGNEEVARKAAQVVGSYIEQCEGMRTFLDDKMAACYNTYNGEPLSRFTTVGRSVHVPEAFKAVEGWVPRIMGILLGRPEWFRVIGADDQGRANADAIRKLMLSQLRRDNFVQKFTSLMRDVGIYGWAPCKLRWKPLRVKKRYNEVTTTPAVDGQNVHLGRTVKLEQKEVALNMDGPTLERVDIYDWFIDLRYQNEQEAPGIAIRSEYSEAEVRQLKKTGWFMHLDDLLRVDDESIRKMQGPGGALIRAMSMRQLRDGSDGFVNEVGAEKASYRIFEFFEYWGRFDPDYDQNERTQGQEEEYVITLARRKRVNQGAAGWIVLRVAKNPLWHGQRPCMVAHFIRRSHCFQSIGILEPAMRLFEELDDSRNMALMARSLAANPTFIADDNADIFGPNLVLEPGTIIRARDSSAVKALHVPDTTDVAFKSEAVIKRDIEETTGMPKLFSGQEGGSTATETTSMVREANKRIAEAARNIANGFLRPMLDQWLALNQQLLTEERKIEILGEDGLVAKVEAIGPEKIAGRVFFEIEALPDIELAGIAARERVAFLQTAAPYLQTDPGMMNVEKLLKDTYEELFGRMRRAEVFPRDGRPKKYRTVHDEHMLFAMGHQPEIQPGENLRAHVEGHTKFMASEVFRHWPKDARLALMAHRENTVAEMTREIEEAIPRLPQGMEHMEPGASGGPSGQSRGQVPGRGGGQGQATGFARFGGQPTQQGMVRGMATANAPPKTPGGGL